MEKITIKLFNLKTMKYSTLKKTAALSLAASMVVGLANAQTMTKDSSMKMSSDMTTAKVFGGAGQFNKFSIGLNVGILSQALATGGSNFYTHKLLETGYGVSLREQLSYSWGLQLDVHGGTLKGDDGVRDNGNYSTRIWNPTLSAIFNVGNISWLHRKDFANFFVTGGGGLILYQPKGQLPGGQNFDYSVYNNVNGVASTNHYARSLVIPIGAGVKFRLADAVALNLGYTENFLDDDNLDGSHNYPMKSHYSYGYAGLEFTLGSGSKKNIDWVNPVAMMYDELYDAALRQEVEALKGRVTNVENAVNDLKKDSDGDGVSDQFDKCPGTPAGTVVDGSGCAIVFPKADTTAKMMAPMATGYSNIQFEFDSSVLRTSSYPVLDATSADLRTNSGKMVELDGFASSEGTAAHNMRLSKDRANSVKTYLVNSGVDAKRLKVKAYGETHPIADNSTEEGRVANRRVEFKQK